MIQKFLHINNSDKHGRFKVFCFSQGCNNDFILQEYDTTSKNNRIQTFRGNRIFKLELANELIRISYQQRGGFYHVIKKLKKQQILIKLTYFLLGLMLRLSYSAQRDTALLQSIVQIIST